MNRQETLASTTRYFSRLITEVEAHTEIGFYDINRLLEDIFKPILNILYDLETILRSNMYP